MTKLTVSDAIRLTPYQIARAILDESGVTTIRETDSELWVINKNGQKDILVNNDTYIMRYIHGDDIYI